MKFEKNTKLSKKKHNSNNKKDPNNKNLVSQIDKFKTMIQETIVYCYKYKSMDIIDSNQLHVALNTAENIFNDIIIII